MRRAILTIGGTAAGLAALLSFKTHSTAATDSLAAPSTPSSVASPSGASPTVASPKKRRMAVPSPKAVTSHKAASPTAAASSGAAMTTRTITGSAASTMYGPVQVKVTLTGQKITNVAMLQDTNDGSESQSIDSFAIPKLTSETLTVQSARIDAVSGATQTSDGYIQSLQSALDQASA